MMDPCEFERKLVHETIMSSSGIAGNKLKEEDCMKELIFIPNDHTYFKILDYEIHGHGDLQEFLKDLEECKEAQHRWNELKVFLMKYRREKSRFGYGRGRGRGRGRTLLCCNVNYRHFNKDGRVRKRI